MIINKNNYSLNLLKNANVIIRDRIKHLSFSLASTSGFGDGLILEFGVYLGGSIKQIADHFRPEIVYGFDSFVGLPEQWFLTEDNKADHPIGHFSLQGKMPAVDKNVILVKGFFEDILKSWADDCVGQRIKFLHIDSDLYSSCNTILQVLNDFIVEGTTIVFDDMYWWDKPEKYTLWAEGEYKALGEWLELYNREIESTSIVEIGSQCCIKVKV